MSTKSIIRIALAAIAATLLLVLLLKEKNVDEQKQNLIKYEEQKEKKDIVTKITPAHKSVSGPLHDFFEVVERTYKLNNGKLNVELRRIEDGFPEPWTSGMEMGYSGGCFEPGFYIEVMDDDGDVIGKDETSVISDKHDLLALAELNKNETTTIGFYVGSVPATRFRIGSSFKVNEEKITNESEDVAVVPIPQSDACVEEKPSSEIETLNDDDITDEQYDVVEEDCSEDVDKDKTEERSLWQKVKEKSKKTYKKTKEYSKKIYNKAKRKFIEWLDE